jgi:hypothetical protein
MIKKLIKIGNYLDSAGFKEEASKIDEIIQKCAENEIGRNEPYVVIDSDNGKVVYLTSFEKRNNARRWRDRKDNEYGGYRYMAKLILEDNGSYAELKEKLEKGIGPVLYR